MTNQELGYRAFYSGIDAPCLDPDLMERLKGIKVGDGAVEVMEQWYKGWNDAQDEEMREKFPEMYE